VIESINTYAHIRVRTTTEVTTGAPRAHVYPHTRLLRIGRITVIVRIFLKHK